MQHDGNLIVFLVLYKHRRLNRDQSGNLIGICTHLYTSGFVQCIVGQLTSAQENENNVMKYIMR